ncbi:MAG: lipopolysaccharide biosynthesis protein [Verrucomicrobiales bacterium]
MKKIKELVTRRSFGRSEAIFKLNNWLIVLLLAFGLSKREYGILGLILVYLNITDSVFNSSIDKSTFKYGKKYIDSHLILSITLLFIGIIIGILYLLINNYILLWTSLILIAAAVTTVNRSRFAVLRYQDNRKEFEIKKIKLTIFILISNLIFLVVFKKSIGFLFAIIISNLLIINIFDLRKNKLNLSQIKTFILFSLPFFINAILKNIYTFFDRQLITTIISKEATAEYTLMYSFATVIIFTNYIHNINEESKLFRNSGREHISEYIKKGYIVAMIGSLLSVVLYTIYIKLFLKEYSYNILGLLLMLISNSLIIYYSLGLIVLTKNDKTKKIVIISAFAAVTSLSINFLLIPSIGINGAIISNFIASSLSTCLIVRFCSELSKKPLIISLSLGVILSICLCLSF